MPNPFGFEQFLLEAGPVAIYDGSGMKFRFPNCYGASLVCHSQSFGGKQGLWELAVLKFEPDSDKWQIDYKTGITDSVIGWLDVEDAREILGRIMALPA